MGGSASKALTKLNSSVETIRLTDAGYLVLTVYFVRKTGDAQTRQKRFDLIRFAQKDR